MNGKDKIREKEEIKREKGEIKREKGETDIDR